jgi:hypothetical protein
MPRKTTLYFGSAVWTMNFFAATLEECKRRKSTSGVRKLMEVRVLKFDACGSFPRILKLGTQENHSSDLDRENFYAKLHFTVQT